MPGPLPSPTRRRRNAPTIPTTNLPVGGRTGSVPRPPKWVALGPAGTAWWKWAWHTPQAAAWNSGHVDCVAKRATLEDDLAAVSEVRSLDALDLLAEEDERAIRFLIGTLAGLATGRLAIKRDMRELDKVLGLTPKGMADLRWTIVADPEPDSERPPTDEVTQRRDDRRARISAS